MEVLDYARLVRRRWRLVAACVLGVALIGAATTPTSAELAAGDALGVPTFTATHIVLRQVGIGSAGAMDPNLIALLARSDGVRLRVAEVLPERLRPLAAGVQITVEEKLGVIEFTAVSADADDAVTLADAYAEETQRYFIDRSLTSANADAEGIRSVIVSLDRRITEIVGELAGLEVESAEATTLLSEQEALTTRRGTLSADLLEIEVGSGRSGGLTSLQPAIAAATITGDPLIDGVVDETGGRRPAGGDSRFGLGLPSGRAGRGLAGALVGLMLGLGLAFTIDRLDPRLRTRREVEEYFGLPVIAEVPHRSRRKRRHTSLPSVLEPTSLDAEVYRSMQVALRLMPRWKLGAQARGASEPVNVPAGDSRQMIVITSPGVGEGKTTTSANLAASVADTGRRVLLLDVDLHRPAVHEIFGTRSTPGIRDVLAGRVLNLERCAVDPGLPNLTLVPGGSSKGARGELQPPDAEILAAAERIAPVVIVDTGPLLASSEAVSLVSQADAVVIVARSGKTTQEAARLTRERLEQMHASVAGVVLVGVRGDSISRPYLLSSSRYQKRHRRGSGTKVSVGQPEGG